MPTLVANKIASAVALGRPHAVGHRRLDLNEAIGADRAAWVTVPRRWAMSRRGRDTPHISWRDAVAAENYRKRRARPMPTRREQRRQADLSVSRSDLDADWQLQLDETRLQQRHGQVIVQFNPGVGVARRPSELLEDDLACLPKG